jgi:4-hydroxymandelate oxidase
VQRVEAAGCRALVLTVDAPLLGRRERDVKNRFGLPPELGVENLLASGYAPVPSAGTPDSGLAAYFAELLDPALTWDVLPWLRSITKLPILVKGIVRADDAVRAVERGAAGIVVSNHGGRQLDASIAVAGASPAPKPGSSGCWPDASWRSSLRGNSGMRRSTHIPARIVASTTPIVPSTVQITARPDRG